jgi:hypothetical protein
MIMEEDLEKEKKEIDEEPEDFSDIAREIAKLSDEVKEVKDSFSSEQAESQIILTPLSQKKNTALELTPALEYINEVLQNSSEQIISEMKTEFYRLFNFLSSMLAATPPQKEKRISQEKRSSTKPVRTVKDEQLQDQVDLEGEKELFQLLLDERESLIYELSDQLVAIETEKKEINDKLKILESDKEKWDNQKSVFERLITTDPRFNIINLLRRMGVIAPIQLSFVLGVSLSQTRKYILELEQMKIIQINEDDTISLHSAFNEETMNIRMTGIKENKE